MNFIKIQYNLNNLIFSRILLKYYINKFWTDNINILDSNKHIMIMFRIKSSDGLIKSRGKLQRLNKEDKDYYINYLLNILDMEELNPDMDIDSPIISLIFEYIIRKGNVENKESKSNVKYQTYYRNKLPIYFNPLDYGKLLKQKDNLLIIKVSDKVKIKVTQVENNNEKYNLVEYYKKNKLLFNWKDIYINENSFKRELGKSIYTYEFNELVLLKVIKSAKFINPIKTQRVLNNKIITMDCETISIGNKLSIYLICWFDGVNKKSYFINDFKNIESMVLQVIKDLCIKKYDNYKVYLHNLSKFDGIFLLKHLVNIGKCNPLIHDNKLISIQFKYKSYVIHFRDSYLLLPSSLAKLGKSFNVETLKSHFPVLFNNINHSGSVPDIKYFANITPLEYMDYLNSFNYQI